MHINKYIYIYIYIYICTPTNVFTAIITLFNLLPENEKFTVVMQNKTSKVMKALESYILTCLKNRGLRTFANQIFHKVLAKM